MAPQRLHPPSRAIRSLATSPLSLPTLSPFLTEHKTERKPELRFRPPHRHRRSVAPVNSPLSRPHHLVFQRMMSISPNSILPLVHRSRQNLFSSSSLARTSLSVVHRPPITSVLLLCSGKSPLTCSFSCARYFAMCLTEPQKPLLHREPPPLFVVAPSLRAIVGLAAGTHGTTRR